MWIGATDKVDSSDPRFAEFSADTVRLILQSHALLVSTGSANQLEASSGKFVPYGPGTEIHVLLGRFGLTASGDCKCNSRAALMDANGCDWCEANIDEIVGWLRESAAERGLPFLDAAGSMRVRRAIAHPRRKVAARVAQEASDRPHVHAQP